MSQLSVQNWFGDLVSHPKAVVEAKSETGIARILRDTAKYPSPVRGVGSNHSTSACGVAQGGTVIIPGRGRVSDVGDVANYRNMVYIVRDRIKDLKMKGRTLQQVKAAKPTLDYDGRWGATTGPWTTDMFIDAVYKTVK